MKKKIINIIGNVVFAIVMVVLAAVIFTSIYAKKNGNNPSFFGYSFSVVLTESMSGEIEKGELIIYKSCSISDVALYDNIVFKSIDPSSPIYGYNVVHKAIEISNTDVISITTKGVNNAIADKYAVTSSNFIGIVTCHNMFLGKVVTFFQTPLNIIFLVLVFAIIYGVLAVVKKVIKDEKEGS